MTRAESREVLPVLGEEVDRYRVIAELAQGGMAAVYVVHRQTAGFDKLFAMKVMLPHLRSDSQFSTMFLDEAQIGSKIQHPNVVQIFDVGDRYGSPFMVMELLRGKSFSHIMKAKAQGRVFMSRGLLFWILARVADGLHAAHTAAGHDSKPLNIIHRDVSFQNIHIGFDGQVKVVDFGIADAEGRVSRTRTGEVMGKIQFMAPEQFNREHPIDRRVDIWSLGVVAWRALTGSKLFRGKSDAETMWNVVHGEVPDISQACDQPLPPAVEHMVMSCLSRDPRQRPASAAKIAEVFHQAAVAEGASTEELASFMSNAFVDAKRAEETALAEAMNNPQDFSDKAVLSEMFAMTPSDGSEPISGPEVSLTEIAGAKKSPWVAILATCTILVVAAAAAVYWSQLKEKDSQSSADLAAASAPEEPVASAETKPPVEKVPEKPPVEKAPEKPLGSVQIRLGAEVRMALVDGVRHDERPLVIMLAKDAKAEVTVLTADSEKVWTIGIKDDGRLLELPKSPDAGTQVVEKDPPVAATSKKTPRKKGGKKKGGKKKDGKKKDSTGGLIEVPL